MKTPPQRVPAPTPSSKYLQHRLPIAVLWAATLLAYANSFQTGLIFDNASRILQDTRIQAATWENIRLIFQSDYWHPNLGSGLYRPLATLSFLFNYSVLGNSAQPFGYHVVNWLLHSVNASLLYFLALRLLKDRVLAFAVAAIWAVHPVLTESVTNVVGRADILAALGVIGGLLAYIESTEAAGNLRVRWLAVAALAAAVGVFSKESAIVVLGAALLYDVFARRKPWLPGYIALALPSAVYWIARTQVFAHAAPRVIPFTDNPLARAPFLSAKLTAIKIVGKELFLLMWPTRLSADYSYNQIPLSSAGDWRAWAALGACLGLAVLAWIAYRKNSPVFFWIGWAFLTLAPTSNLAVAIGAPMAERFLYLPAIGFAGCLVAGVSAAFAGKRARTPALILGTLGVMFASRTFLRNFDWQDEKSLWISAVVASPKSYKTHMTLGAIIPVSNPVALEQTEAAIAIVDGVPDEINTAVPYINGGRLYREAGGTAAYNKALDLLLHADRIRRAHEERNRREGTPANNAATASPLYAPLYQELGRVYARLSRFDEAVQAFRTALRFRLAPELYEELSVAYFRKGDSANAATALLEGILTNPRNGKLASEVISLYQQIDPATCAMQTVNGQSGLNLNCAPVHENFCAAAINLTGLYRDMGQPASAEQTVQGAIQTLHCDPKLFGR